jgi:hypothetical protein
LYFSIGTRKLENCSSWYARIRKIYFASYTSVRCRAYWLRYSDKARRMRMAFSASVAFTKRWS